LVLLSMKEEIPGLICTAPAPPAWEGVAAKRPKSPLMLAF
jgi:hypothetical protein